MQYIKAIFVPASDKISLQTIADKNSQIDNLFDIIKKAFDTYIDISGHNKLRIYFPISNNSITVYHYDTKIYYCYDHLNNYYVNKKLKNIFKEHGIKYIIYPAFDRLEIDIDPSNYSGLLVVLKLKKGKTGKSYMVL